MSALTHRARHILVGLLVVVLIAGSTQARPSGITGDEAEGGTDVAKTGCTCHSGNAIAPDDSVTVLVADVPYHFAPEQAYTLIIEIIGGPEIGGTASAGFSMRVSDGMLSAGAGYEDMVQNGDDAMTLTHTEAASNPTDRSWTIDWTAPAAGSGDVTLHHMWAPFRAHWLGLLGFGAVVAVILFCGFFLRYGFSRHYEGRSNLVRLRMKHLRRGDQL